LTYSTNPAVYVKGAAITNNVPSSTGGAVLSYAGSPALPSGLNLDATTGVISGSPLAVAPATDYAITATNSGGSATAVVNISVADAAPSAPSPSSAPLNLP